VAIDAKMIPAAAGAYALLVRLHRPLRPGISAFGDPILRPGAYIYCGSAYGSGGLAARVARHLRSGKPLRWHIDRLTEAGRIAGVAVRVGGYECDLLDALIADGATIPIPGFGSSDCRRCPAHLVAAPDDFDDIALDAVVALGRDAAPSL
jgi:Uri superfamily endonuclease